MKYLSLLGILLIVQFAYSMPCNSDDLSAIVEDIDNSLPARETNCPSLEEAKRSVRRLILCGLKSELNQEDADRPDANAEDLAVIMGSMSCPDEEQMKLTVRHLITCELMEELNRGSIVAGSEGDHDTAEIEKKKGLLKKGKKAFKKGKKAYKIGKKGYKTYKSLSG